MLHITSINFDEPKCVQLVETSQYVVAVHGCDDKDVSVYVGGLDVDLKRRVVEALKNRGFKAEIDKGNHSGNYSENICNRGIRRRGLQLEISEGLRMSMFEGLSRGQRKNHTQLFDDFVTTIREALI